MFIMGLEDCQKLGYSIMSQLHTTLTQIVSRINITSVNSMMEFLTILKLWRIKIMELLKIPNPVLKTKCENIPHVSMELLGQIDEMIQIAKDNNLVGMAANQVGLLQNVFVMNVGENWQAFINPVIKRHNENGKSWDWEGCGSIPNLLCLVERHNIIDVNYMSIDGESKSIQLSGFLARIAQHETDHLLGILITDKARQRKKV